MNMPGWEHAAGLAAASRRGSVALAVAAALLLVPVHARAQVQTDSAPAFALDRFMPAPGQSPYWAAEDGDVLLGGAYTLGLATSLMYRPIVLQDVFDRDEVSEPVRLRLGTQLGAAIGLGRRYQLGLAVPLVAYQSGERLQGIGLDETPLAAAALGDMRVHGKMRLLGQPGAWRGAVAVAGDLSLPTGDEEHFAGEENAVIGVQLIGSWRSPWWSAAVTLGARLRTEEVILLSPARPHGDELVGMVAGALVIPGLPRRALQLAAEYSWVRGDSRSSGSVRGPSPGEARIGLGWTSTTGWTVGAAVGAGSTPSEVGSPAWRLVLMVRRDTHPASDIDGDGIIDGLDRCRAQPEDRDGFADGDGCPDPDNDGDGYPDDSDDCPDAAEDFDGSRDVDGCPDP